jgi:UDP-N-acetylmuramate--alanine ligase
MLWRNIGRAEWGNISVGQDNLPAVANERTTSLIVSSVATQVARANIMMEIRLHAQDYDTMDITLDQGRRYHFVGIGGIGMSAIAQILLSRHFRVSGSDAKDSPLLERLRTLGAEVFVGHDAGHVRPDDIVILSDAINADNPEWAQAREWRLPIYKRADVLGSLSNVGRGVAVSGTHGKTTTSGMLALILVEAGMDPTCVLGGELAPLGGNARAGGDLVLVEACEAFNSFLDLRPRAAIVTNIDVDHLSFHGTPEHLYESFRQFLRQVQEFAVLNGDDKQLARMLSLPPRAVTYGAFPQHDYRFSGVQLGEESKFILRYHDEDLGVFSLQVPGLHNVYNATAAAALAYELGADLAAIRRGLAAFPGMHRRFERLGYCGQVAVVDDYAHHPTEIRATLSAARAVFPGRVVAVFQPHLFSRTRDLMDEFVPALGLADCVFVAPIYAAREEPIDGITHQALVQRLQRQFPRLPVFSLSSLAEGIAILTQAAAGRRNGHDEMAVPALHAGDVILTIGAGDVDALARALIHS